MSEFITQLGMLSIQAGICICIVLLVRGIFYCLNLPKKFSYILWLIPFLLLLLPWLPESEFSFFNQTVWVREYGTGQYLEKAEQENQIRESETVNSSQLENNNAALESPIEENVVDRSSIETKEGNRRKAEAEDMFFSSVIRFAKSEKVQKIFFGIWFLGFLGLVLYNSVLWWNLKQKRVCSVEIEKQVYLSDYIETPFVYGIFLPKIYLPSGIEKSDMDHVIAHERMHIFRKDYIVKLVAFFLVCAHWFNPLVWVAFLCMEQDMEMSCDEAALRKLGEGKKGDYATTLLHITLQQRNISGMPLFFGEGNTRGRIKNIMKKKRELRVLQVVSCVVIAILAVGFLTAPKSKLFEKQEEKNAASDISENVAKEVKEEKEEDISGGLQEMELRDRKVAFLQQKAYTLEVVLKEGTMISDKLSPYYGMYEGKFQLVVEKDGKTEAMDISFGEDLYFPSTFEINISDYNKDGLTDFALGQKIGCNYMEYQFYSVTKDGKIKLLSVDTEDTKDAESLVASDTTFSKEFQEVSDKDRKQGYQICYKEYLMDLGVYAEKMAALHF